LSSIQGAKFLDHQFIKEDCAEWLLGSLVITFVWKLQLSARSLWEVQFKKLRRLKKKSYTKYSDLEASFPSPFLLTPTAFWRQETDSEVMQLTDIRPGNGLSYHEFSWICRITPGACRDVILK
jgi:hypothetical protein